MIPVLTPHVVVVSFTENKVLVNGVEKTCRGFRSRKNGRLNIRCNISRFEKTKDSEQYKLIHHEFAGLARVEKNEGASSDYEISNQITDFLVPAQILKLAVKGSAEFKIPDTYTLFLSPELTHGPAGTSTETKPGHFSSTEKRYFVSTTSDQIYRNNIIGWFFTEKELLGSYNYIEIVDLENFTKAGTVKRYNVVRYEVEEDHVFQALKSCMSLANSVGTIKLVLDLKTKQVTEVFLPEKCKKSIGVF